jgi:hypothetical protein
MSCDVGFPVDIKKKHFYRVPLNETFQPNLLSNGSEVSEKAMFKTFSPQGLLKIYSVMVCIFNF